MNGRDTEQWLALVGRFAALGREADAALATDPERLTALLEEREVVLGQLTATLPQQPAAADRQRLAPVLSALDDARIGTAALTTKVAEHVDMLRSALRNLDRGARASQAYHAATASSGHVDARR